MEAARVSLGHSCTTADFGSWEAVIGARDPMLYRDVWSSLDGINWKEHSSKSAWPGRIWATAASYEGLLWIMGGSIGRLAAAAPMTSGIQTKAATGIPIWRQSHGRLGRRIPLSFSTINCLSLAGSDGDYFNDVWALKIERDEIFPGSSLTRAQKWLYMTFKPKAFTR